MNAYRASLLNAMVLIACSLWAFLTLDKTSYTSLIPAGFGVALLIFLPALKASRLWAILVSMVLTAAILAALYVPLESALEEPASLGLVRIVAMMATSFLALVVMSVALFSRLTKRTA